MDETISLVEIKANFKIYKNSIRRFHVPVEEFFRLLKARNNLLDNVEDDEEQIEEVKEDDQSRGGIEYLAKLPIELKILTL